MPDIAQSTNGIATAIFDSGSAGTGTYVNLPNPATAPVGATFYVTDVGGGAVLVNNGVYWRPVNGRLLLAQSAVAASVTGTASETTLATVAIPAGVMNTSGSLVVTSLWSVTSSANNKTVRGRLGVSAAYAINLATSTATYHTQWITRNRGVANSQVTNMASSTAYAVSANPVTITSIDTAVAQNYTITCQLANSGETATLEAYSVELVA